MAPSGIQTLVRVTGRHELQCTDTTILTDLEIPFRLGPLDHLVFRSVPIQVVFVYERPACGYDAELIPVHRLKQALCRLLDYYPHLMGRLNFDPDTNAPEITALGTGAELLEGQCSQRLDDIAARSASGRILVTNLPDHGDGLLAPFDPSPEGVCRDPILHVQHTRFACGGVSLGVRLHHIVCDAQGFFNLVNDLAEIYRGLGTTPQPILTQPPNIRSYLRQQLSSDEQQAALQYKPSTYMTEDDPRLKELAASAGLADTVPDAGFKIDGRVLRFTGRDLAALKEQATDPSGNGWVSSTEALSAFLCQRVYQARLQFLTSRKMQAEEAAPQQLNPGFFISIDMRPPNRLNMQPRYFPNCIYAPYTNSLHPTLSDCPLWKAASSVHHMIRSVDPETMEKTTQWVAAQPDKGRIRIGFVFGKGSFTVSQWNKMNVYKGNAFDVMDSGAGILPSLVSPPFTQISLVDGLGMLLATEEQVSPGSRDGPSVDVNLSMIQPLWDILDKDSNFRKYYC